MVLDAEAVEPVEQLPRRQRFNPKSLDALRFQSSHHTRNPLASYTVQNNTARTIEKSQQQNQQLLLKECGLQAVAASSAGPLRYCG